MSNLVKCKACNAVVSKKAPACPKCGEPQKRQRFGCLSVIVGGVLLILVISAFNPGPTTTSTTVSEPEAVQPSAPSVGSSALEQQNARQPSLTVSALDLYNAYDANEVAADQKYKNKYAIVTGKVYKIEVTFGMPQISLQTTNYGLPILCTLSASESNQVAQLAKGQNVKVLGKISGKSIGISISDCSVH